MTNVHVTLTYIAKLVLPDAKGSCDLIIHSKILPDLMAKVHVA